MSSFWSEDYKNEVGQKMTGTDMEDREGTAKDNYWRIADVPTMLIQRHDTEDLGKPAKEILRKLLLRFL